MGLLGEEKSLLEEIEDEETSSEAKEMLEEEVNEIKYELDELQVEEYDEHNDVDFNNKYIQKIDGWVRSTPIGVVIGILVVAVLVLSLILFFCFRRYCCLRRRRSKKKTQVDDFDNSINFVTDGLITNLERTRNLQKNNKPYSDTVASNLAHNHDSSTFMDVELADDTVRRFSGSFKNMNKNIV